MPSVDALTIRDIHTKILHAPINEQIGMSFGGLWRRSTALVEVEAEGGLVGYGESWINYPPWAEHERVATVREGIAPLLVGQDATRINELHARMVEELMPMGIQWGAVGPIMQAISGVDLALWDLKSKAMGLAVNDLLGGRIRDSIPVYASGLGPNKVAEVASRCREVGFTAVKARVGFGPEVDESTLANIRHVMGGNVTLFADANQAWTLREALAAADMLSRYGVGWIEEPIRGDCPEQLEEFSRETGLEVATGENVYGAEGFLSYATSPLIGVLQPDISKTGGITEMVRICYLAAATNKSVIPHLYGGPVALAATLQLASCLRQVKYVEFDVRENPLREELLVHCLQPENGHLKVPEGLGLGVEVDHEALERFASTGPTPSTSQKEGV